MPEPIRAARIACNMCVCPFDLFCDLHFGARTTYALFPIYIHFMAGCCNITFVMNFWPIFFLAGVFISFICFRQTANVLAAVYTATAFDIIFAIAAESVRRNSYSEHPIESVRVKNYFCDFLDGNFILTKACLPWLMNMPPYQSFQHNSIKKKQQHYFFDAHYIDSHHSINFHCVALSLSLFCCLTHIAYRT